MSPRLSIVLGKKQYFAGIVFWFYPIDKEDIVASVRMQKTSFWLFKTTLLLSQVCIKRILFSFFFPLKMLKKTFHIFFCQL